MDHQAKPLVSSDTGGFAYVEIFAFSSNFGSMSNVGVAIGGEKNTSPEVGEVTKAKSDTF